MRRLTLCMLALAISIGSTFAQDDDLQSYLLDIREEDSVVRYGEYAEVEITATEPVNLAFTNEVVPFGMDLEKIDDQTYVIYGQVAFLGKLCFLVDAQKVNGEFTTERLCVYGEENEDIEYPRFTTERFLNAVEELASFSRSIELESSQPAELRVMGELPQGMTLNRGNNAVTLQGRMTQAGVYEVVLEARELNSEIVSYKQFVLEVYEQDRQYQCAPGYYWDEYLQYCVQANGRMCGELTFYDFETGSCIPYGSRRYCRAGTHFDHFLNRCVRVGARRCPIDYKWDGYYSRWVRLPYRCGIASRYNYRSRRCVSIYRTVRCGGNSYYDSYRNRCMPRYRACARGGYWNGRVCVRHSRTCSVGRYFDPRVGRCVARHTRRACGPASRYEPSTGRCIRRVVNRTCSIGSRYSRRLGRCVIHDRGRINRRPDRLTKPNRPTTRPDRPSRPSGPSRPDRPRRPRPNRN